MPNGNIVTWATSVGNGPTDAIMFAASWKRSGKYPTGTITWKDEPLWRKPSTLVDLFSYGNASNQVQVQRAFSYSTPVFDILPHVRNFYAHRSRQTLDPVYDDIRNYGLPKHEHPTDLMLDAMAGRPQNIISEWIDDIRITIDVLCR